MNTINDLQTELELLADQAPSDADVREAIAERVAAQGKRRRTTALIVVAASVVLVAGGASIATAVLSHRSSGPAAPSPVVQVPRVPLPANTQLIRHDLQPVQTPVTSTPPDGLTGQMWMATPGHLAVSWFDPGAKSEGMLGSTGSSGAGSDEVAGDAPRATGYVITNDRDDGLTTIDEGGPRPVAASHRDMAIGGRSVYVDTAPSGTTDQWGFPADERISWQLSDGRWIHVWATPDGSDSTPQPTSSAQSSTSPSPTLVAFAMSITEVPQTLYRAVGIGLTLPSLTVDSTVNTTPLAGMAGGATVFLCPVGVDPLAPSYGSSSGSASAVPDGTTSTETETSPDPTAKCLSAVVFLRSSLNSDTIPPGTDIAVGGTLTHVDVGKQLAWADLDHGLSAAVAAPRSGPFAGQLSAADLAALVASVRLSPGVSVLPLSAQHIQGDSASSTSETQPWVGSSSAAETLQPTSVTEAGTGSVAASSAVASSDAVDASSHGNTGVIVDRHEPESVLMAYLDALTADDCATSQRFAAPTFRLGNGELCGAATVTGYSLQGAPAVTTTEPATETFAVNLTTSGTADRSVPAGVVMWFYTLAKQPDGTWLLTGGGTGP